MSLWGQDLWGSELFGGTLQSLIAAGFNPQVFFVLPSDFVPPVLLVFPESKTDIAFDLNPYLAEGELVETIPEWSSGDGLEIQPVGQVSNILCARVYASLNEGDRSMVSCTFTTSLGRSDSRAIRVISSIR